MRSGLMMAVLRTAGTYPACREWFITVVIRGLMAEMLAFTRAVGKGSRAQVEGFILLMMSSTSRCETSGKQLRGWEISKCEQAVRAGRVKEPERTERIESILVLKKAMKLSQCSSVVSVSEGVCGLRR